MRQLKTFGGDRAMFRERNEKLLNALAHVNPGCRKAVNNLNNKLGSLGGVLDEDEDDMARVLSGRLMSSEYTKATTAKQSEDDD